MLSVEVISANNLTEEHIAVWRGLQDQNPAIASPYFSPQFTMAVARVRDRASVAILNDGRDVVGFFPFELKGNGIGKPIGGPMSDLHGVISAPGTDWDPIDLIRGCGLKVLDFDHLLACQTAFAPFHTRIQESPWIDLSQGFDRYVAERRASGSKVIKKLNTMRRKAERDAGPVRFEMHTDNREVLDSLIEGKSQQYHRSNGIDVFSYDWTIRLLEEIQRTQDEDFAGMLSTLYFGDNLAAVHMGMRSQTVWHYWFPTYSAEFSSFSPGAMLLLEIAKAASALGITTIDLGKGDADYKMRFSNGGAMIAEGFVSTPSVEGSVRKALNGAGKWSSRLPLGRISNWPGKALNKLQRSRRFD